MDMDLSQALRDAADTGTAHRQPITVGPVVRRIHRRRAARVAVESTVGVAAAGAVAVGAVQVTAMRTPDPAPVAPATATPDPSPDPTTDPTTGVPVAVTVAADPGCGLPMPAVTDPAGDAELRVEPTLVVDGLPVATRVPEAAAAADGAADGATDGATLAVGETLAVDVVLANGSDSTLDAVATGPAQVWFIAPDGTVAGLLGTPPAGQADGPDDGPDAPRYSGRPGARFSGERLSGVPTACAVDGAPGEALGPGTYRLYVVQGVQLSATVTQRVTGAPATVVVEAPPTQEPVTPPDDADPAPGAHPDLEDLVLSPAGLGPLAVGVPVRTNPGAAMVERDPDFCDTEVFPETEPARWVASGYPSEDLFGEPRSPFFVDADDDAVHRIDVLGPTIRTAEGIRNGSTVAELQAAYPQLEGPFAEHDLSRVWWLTGPTGTLVFETQSRDADGQIAADQPERVILMRVLAAGTDPRFQTANSDDIAGGCL